VPYRLPVAPPKTRLPLLADVTIKTPCKVPWDSMVGDDRARYCCTCSKNVYNLSAMTEDEAESFLALHLDDEDACVRLYRRSDGTVLTTDCPVGATRRHRAHVALAASAAMVAITAVAAAAADVRVPRAHSPLHGLHEPLFEPPRAPGGTPERYTIPNATSEQLAPWGHEEFSSPQGFGNYTDRPSLQQGAVQMSKPGRR
jgi:hypothetical protein